MSLYLSVESQLPFMRRYARAVTGSATTGDTLVESLLTRMLGRNFDPPADPSDEVLLFTELDAIICEQIDTQNSTGPLPPMAQKDRRALLLVAMEGLSPQDASAVLGVSVDEIQSLLKSAEEHLKATLATDVFIMEDEPMVAGHLAMLVSDMGHHVVGKATTRTDAVAGCLTSKPKILLADVQLADGSSGIDAAHEITAAMDIPVVYITAYPQRLLSGSGDKEPAFMVAKPFRPAMVKAVISQALISRSAAFSTSR